MSIRFLIESLLTCLLVGGGAYLTLGSADAMPSVASFAITLGTFLTEIAPRILTSPESIVSLTAIALLGVFFLSRKSTARALR